MGYLTTFTCILLAVGFLVGLVAIFLAFLKDKRSPRGNYRTTASQPRVVHQRGRLTSATFESTGTGYDRRPRESPARGVASRDLSPVSHAAPSTPDRSTDSSFGTSFAVAYATDSVAMGVLAGGDILGAMAGESLADHSHRHTDSGSSSSADSRSSNSDSSSASSDNSSSYSSDSSSSSSDSGSSSSDW